MTPLEADNARRASQGGANGRWLRAKACAECGVVRPYHLTVVDHRWRRMTAAEWADYCGTSPEPRQDPRDVGLELPPGMSAWNFPCGHSAILQAGDAVECPKCKKQGDKMGWLNGKDRDDAPAGARTPAEVPMDTHKETQLQHPHRTAPPLVVNPFAKAVKYDARGRIALIGPAGSGKSYTMLLAARALAGPTGKIAAIDTEHGSLSKYADVFSFDVLELSSFTPESFITALHAAEENGYDVFCCDSLSHFWVGKDGAFDFVDMAQKRNKDQMGGWKEFRPHERLMVDEMVSSPCHVICTLRTKTDYVEQTDANGKKKRVKIGLAPVQREGLEYEFDLVGYMDDENTFVTDKTRCSHYSQKAFSKPGPKEFAPFVDWLKGEARNTPPKPIQEPRIDTGGHPPNTAAAAQHVAQQKIAAGDPSSQATWRTMGECERAFAAKQEEVGELQFREVLDRYGWKSFPDIRRSLDGKDSMGRDKAKRNAAQCYAHLDTISRKGVS